MKSTLFAELKKEKTAARELVKEKLADLEPVYQRWAQFAGEEDYTDRNTDAACWACMRETAEYAAVENALVFYLIHPFRGSRGTAAFILASDPSLEEEDLYMRCYETVLSRLVRVYRNVSKLYNTKKGMVQKAEGWVLYIDRMVGSFLCDEARRYDPSFGRRSTAGNVRNHFETSGRTIRGAEELCVGDCVIRKANRVGTFSGSAVREGVRYACVDFPDGCRDYIPWDTVGSSVRLFTGNVREVTCVDNDREEKTPKARSVSLDALLNEEEDGISLMKLMAGGESCEEALLRNEMNDVLRRSYLSTAESLQNDFANAMMFFYLIHDYLNLEFTHYPDILNQLRSKDPLELARSLHRQNCLMLNIAPDDSPLDLRRETARESFTVRQLTVAKNQVKSLFRRNLTAALAA